MCSGNTCRSPLGQLLMARERPSWQVRSAGTTANEGAPASDGTLEVARRRLGADLGGHRSHRLAAADLEAVDLALTMTEAQRRWIADAWPEHGHRVMTLADAAGERGDVDDPFGGPPAAYDQTLARIERLVRAAAANLSREAPLGRVVAVGADHAGYLLKDAVAEDLRGQGFRVEDAGTHSDASVDYPDFAQRVARAVVGGQAGWGVLVCGTGLGMSITANKVPGVRAAAVSDDVSARLARAHNDANVICFGGRIVGPEVGRAIVRAFAATPWEGGRHGRRLEKIAAVEAGGGLDG